MDRIADKLDNHFFATSVPKECWDKILCLAVEHFREFFALRQTCQSLRTLVSAPVIIKPLFKTPLPSIYSIDKVIAFLEQHVSGALSEGLTLDFSQHLIAALNQSTLEKILSSFPRLCKLNLCLQPRYPLEMLLYGAYLQKSASYEISFPPHLELVLWKVAPEEELKKNLLNHCPTLKLRFVCLPLVWLWPLAAICHPVSWTPSEEGSNK
jgi:hypothetical protein